MLVCSLAFLPVLMVYANNPVHELQTEGKYFINMFSLGNLGGSDVVCTASTLMKASIGIKCPTGTFIDSDSITYGVMDSKIVSQDYCTNEAIWAKKQNHGLYHCTSLIDNDKFKS